MPKSLSGVHAFRLRGTELEVGGGCWRRLGGLAWSGRRVARGGWGTSCCRGGGSRKHSQTWLEVKANNVTPDNEHQ